MNTHFNSASTSAIAVSRYHGAHHVEPELYTLIAAHKGACAVYEAASRATDKVRIGREPSKAAEVRYRKADNAEDDAFMALLAYVPRNDASRRLKAEYILPLALYGQISDERMGTLLMSMCGTHV